MLRRKNKRHGVRRCILALLRVIEGIRAVVRVWTNRRKEISRMEEREKKWKRME